MEKDIEDMAIAEYIKYEAEMKRQSWRDSQSYFPTKYDNWDVGSFHLEENKTSDYPYYTNDAKIDAYYDLPPLLPCFKPIQPYTKWTIDNTDAPDAPNLEPYDEGMCSDDDVDEWFMKTSETDTVLEAFSMASNNTVEEDSRRSRTLPCQFQPKELSPGIFEYQKLTNLKKADVLVGMANMTQQAPLGTVENVLVKIDKFVFP
ncbi:hypothetical protein Tco_0337702 [Tanacetum coccineum]